jgi:hypothetical protein
MAVHLSAEDPCCAAKPERFISASPAAAQPGPPFVRTVALITRDDTAKIISTPSIPPVRSDDGDESFE